LESNAKGDRSVNKSFFETKIEKTKQQERLSRFLPFRSFVHAFITLVHSCDLHSNYYFHQEENSFAIVV